jgi:signal transduction histidine kinase
VARRRSIATRWALGYALVILAAIAGIGGFVDRRAERIVLLDGQTLLELEAQQLAGALGAGGSDLDARLATSVAAADPDLRFGAEIFDTGGARRAARGSAREVNAPLPAELLSGDADRAFREVEAGRSEPYWVLALRAGDAGWVQVTLYSRSFVRRAHRVRYAFLAGLPLAAIVSLIVGGALARASFRPISGMLDSVRAIRGGALDVRVPVRGTGDELDQIAVAFNGALDRLEASMEALTRFSHDAAHQLRSPLTALRGRIEVAQHAQPASGELRPLLDGLLEDATRLSELVDAILALSRTSAGLRAAQRQAVGLAALLGEVVEFFEPLAREKGIALGIRDGDLGARVTVSGDPAWLHQLFVNLVENAIHFTGPGGRIEVSLRREPGDAVVEVRDTGRGIPPAELERVFERFHRLALPGDEPGVGIGLPLAREIARIHGGDVAAASVAGVGSTFSVRLPLASAE